MTTRLLFLIIFIVSISQSFGQGLYKSSDNSFRKDYFLDIKNDSVTLFGWEVWESDTVFFKSQAVPKSKHISFQEFWFFDSPEAVMLNKRYKTSVPLFIIHRHLTFKKSTRKSFEILMVKDSYDGNVDKFTFTKVK